MKARIGQNPEFATITGLTNRNFNPASITEGQMITEAQMLEVYERIVADEQRADACCRDVIFWEARTQIVRLNSNAIASYTKTDTGLSYPRTTAGGVVVSSWNDNVRYGSMRRGLPYTVSFPIKWDDALYVPMHTSINKTYSNTRTCDLVSAVDSQYENFIAYMYAEDNVIQPTMCDVTLSNRSGFMMSGNADMTSTTRFGVKRANLSSYALLPEITWNSFNYKMENDGTVTIRDDRRATHFSVIRYYTQWTLNECADGSLLTDSFGAAQPWNT